MPKIKPKLYRHYDSEGKLLYIGISTNITARIAAHRSNSHWFDQVSIIKIENFSCLKELRFAEKKAVEQEEPFYNTVYNTNNKVFKERDLLGLHELADYLNIPAGRIRMDIQLKRFPFVPEKEDPFKWMKWKIDLHLQKPEISKHVEKLQE